MLKKWKEVLLDYAFITVGTVLYSASVALLLEPTEISPGGVTGIALILHNTLSIPTGVSVLVLNIPLILLGLHSFGGKFIIKTAYSVFLTSLFIGLFENFSNIFSFDIVISSIFGGVALGFGLGTVMARGSTTGGVDIAVKLINKKNTRIPVGRLFLLIDSTVIITAALVYSNIETALYSIVAVFISSYVIDMLINGSTDSRVFFIISNQGAKIKENLLQKANRGVTLLKAEGGYTGNEKTVLLCAARIGEIKEIKQIIEDCDRDAFFFITNTADINGQGFDKSL